MVGISGEGGESWIWILNLVLPPCFWWKRKLHSTKKKWLDLHKTGPEGNPRKILEGSISTSLVCNVRGEVLMAQSLDLPPYQSRAIWGKAVCKKECQGRCIGGTRAGLSPSWQIGATSRSLTTELQWHNQLTTWGENNQEKPREQSLVREERIEGTKVGLLPLPDCQSARSRSITSHQYKSMVNSRQCIAVNSHCQENLVREERIEDFELMAYSLGLLAPLQTSQGNSRKGGGQEEMGRATKATQEEKWEIFLLN